VTALLVCALSVAGSLFLIVQMDQPYSGLIKISSAPVRAAFDQLGRQRASPPAAAPEPANGSTTPNKTTKDPEAAARMPGVAVAVAANFEGKAEVTDAQEKSN
jgi:hypothetical protein